MVDQLRSRPLDLLLIAAAVFAADAQTGRGGEVRENVGAAWSREFRFVIPVLDAAFWRSNVGALVNALEFLTGDRFAFEFLHRERSERRQPSLALTGGLPRADEVVLFSGGLDSLTGAFESLTSDPAKTILLVTHRSGSKTTGVQTDLAQELQKKFPGQVLWVPVLGTLVNREARASETTQRSRSFLYAALGYGAASLVGTSRILFYENGIVSANLPINHEVVGTMATRTTHSLFFQHMERLLSAIDQKAVAISNPYQSLTKAEVVERLVRLGGAELIGQTNSCSSVRPRTTEHPHCGCCSQCLDRRFAILAAGAEAHDPAGDYRMELWNGRRANYRERTLAVDWTRHGRSLKKMSLV
ncbi:MAG: 7-cyano-7-deazaguanine synthase, partial [Planctomycetes bacterium]|nr:7-cyano-7-deazaguanine synthase [Planctomycetota bacterium]